MKDVVKLKTNKLSTNPDLSVHAEMNAIKNTIIDRKQIYILFVGRLNGAKQWGNSRPCRDCLLRLIKSKIMIKEIIYTTVDGYCSEKLNMETLKSDKTQFSGYIKKRMRKNFNL